MGLVAGRRVELRKRRFRFQSGVSKLAPRTSAPVKSASVSVASTEVRIGEVLAGEVAAAEIVASQADPAQVMGLVAGRGVELRRSVIPVSAPKYGIC